MILGVVATLAYVRYEKEIQQYLPLVKQLMRDLHKQLKLSPSESGKSLIDIDPNKANALLEEYEHQTQKDHAFDKYIQACKKGAKTDAQKNECENLIKSFKKSAR